MKFRSKIFIHFFTFSFLPNVVLFLLLLLLYQHDVEQMLGSGQSVMHTSYTLEFDRFEKTVLHSDFPYSLEAIARRYLSPMGGEKVVFHARGGNEYYRFVCTGLPKSHCDIIRIDAISWLHRVGFTSLFLALVGINLVIIFLTAAFLSHSVTAPIKCVVDWIQSGSIEQLRTKFDIFEVNLLVTKLEKALKQEKSLFEAQKMAAVGQLAQKVAHDVRSPLSSLQVAARGLGEIATGEKGSQFLTLLQMSAARLEAIANGLLKQHEGEEERPTIFSLHAVLDELIGEYQSRDDTPTIRFLKAYHPHAMELYGARCRLQRAIGNIVKNGIEAMQGRGTFTITTSHAHGHATIALQDTGPGMSPEILAKVLQGGHTEGKHDGHGIGTTVVRETAELFGGHVEGESTVGVGTTFRLVLPLPTAERRESAERETLALRELRVPVQAGEPVIVVDDEPSMREQWRVLFTAQDTTVRLCTCYEDVEAQQITADVSHTAIVDYHFANSVHSGLEVIHLLQQRGVEHLILCTAEYWKPSVQQQAKTLAIQLCPKPVPEQILVEVLTDQPVGKPDELSAAGMGSANGGPSQSDTVVAALVPKPNVLVLDDDDGIRLAWRMEQERLGIGELKVFPSMEACEQAKPDYPAYDFAFVDKNIPKSAWRIDQVIAHLKSLGVKRVIVATGESARDVAHDPLCATADGVTPVKIPDSLIQFGGCYDA